MRCIFKKGILSNNSGETMIEVLVAFTLLSIMMVLFSQGIKWATTTTANASTNREAADEAMLHVQQMIVSDSQLSQEAKGLLQTGWGFCEGRVYYKKYEYTNPDNGRTYTYVVYEAITG